MRLWRELRVGDVAYYGAALLRRTSDEIEVANGREMVCVEYAEPLPANEDFGLSMIERGTPGLVDADGEIGEGR
jgi:hypothetical protein